VVEALAAGSVAGRAGVLVGDLLQSVNGQQLRTHKQACQLIDASPAEVALSVAAESQEVCVDKSAGRLGVTFCDNKRGRGVVVASVAAASILPLAGLRVGDTVVSIDGKLLTAHSEAVRLVDAAPEALRFVKWGASRCVWVDKEAGSSEACGITLCDVEADEAVGGVRVLEVRPSGAFFRAGVRPGDVVLAIDGALALGHRQALGLISNSAARIAINLRSAAQKC
jgi:S1-C subfamily serine protease